jgi:predicted MFS family arabinose efflux permease
LGGDLTGAFGWRSVFYINLPLGCLALLIAWRFLPWYRPQQRAGIRLDWPGALLIALALGSLQLFVEWLGHSSLALSAALGLGCISAVIALWHWERRCPHALLPKALFGLPSLRVLFILSVAVGAIMFSLLFYLPLLLQGAYGYSPQDAGLLITPLALSITLGAIVNSRIVTRLRNPNVLPLAGFVALLLACVGLAVVGREASFNGLLGLILLAGLGLGFILLNLTVFTQTLAERQFLGIATALTQSLRLVGGLLGTAGMGVLVNLLYGAQLQRVFIAANHAEGIALYADPQALLHSTLEASPWLDLARDALAQSVGVGLLLCAGIGVLALLILYRLPPVRLHVVSATVAPEK